MHRFIGIAVFSLALAVVFSIHSASAGEAAGAPVNSGAVNGAQNGEWCPSVAVTTLSDSGAGKATRLIGRKSIAVQNLSAATCYATFDAQNPTSTGSLGIRMLPGEMISRDYGDRLPCKVVCTAATTTPSCLQVEQAK